jgi:hypothetical protein
MLKNLYDYMLKNVSNGYVLTEPFRQGKAKTNHEIQYVRQSRDSFSCRRRILAVIGTEITREIG